MWKVGIQQLDICPDASWLQMAAEAASNSTENCLSQSPDSGEKQGSNRYICWQFINSNSCWGCLQFNSVLSPKLLKKEWKCSPQNMCNFASFRALMVVKSGDPAVRYMPWRFMTSDGYWGCLQFHSVLSPKLLKKGWKCSPQNLYNVASFRALMVLKSMDPTVRYMPCWFMTSNSRWGHLQFDSVLSQITKKGVKMLTSEFV